jgi:hypothetical protein
MGFTAQEILVFILAQRDELLRHEKFLHEIYGSGCTREEAAADWTRRYAADYRDVGTRLMLLLEDNDRTSLFSDGMAEIMKHKLIESQKSNYDIGLFCAGHFWMENHAKRWLREKMSK